MNTISKTSLLLLIINFLGYRSKAQERIQSISDGISKLNKNERYISSFLANNGFYLTSHKGNNFSYEKSAQYGSNTFMVSYKNSKVTIIAWTEYIAYMQAILSELFETGFTKNIENTQLGIINYKNESRNLSVTLIMRPDLNDIQITISKVNDTKNTKVNQLADESKPISRENLISTENKPYMVKADKAYFYDKLNDQLIKRKAFLVKGESITALNENRTSVYVIFTNQSTRKTTKGWLLKSDLSVVYVGVTQAPKDLLSVSEIKDKSLTGLEQVKKRGVIYKINSDPEIGMTLEILCKEPSGDGYTSYFLETSFYNNDLPKNDLNNLKSLLKLGRRVEFHFIPMGTGALEHYELLYIKGLPQQSIKINRSVILDGYEGITAE